MAVTHTIGRGAPVAADAVRARLQGKRADTRGVGFRILIIGALAISLVTLLILLVDVAVTGWPVLSTRLGDFVSGDLRTSPDEAGIFQGLRGTFWIGVFTVGLAFPIGIGAALYLEEYAPRNAFTRFIDINIRNLAGVPSIVFGILGFAIFVKSLALFPDWLGGGLFFGGRTTAAAGVTLAILVLPIVIITSAEAIRAVPDSIREAGFGVGATRWEVIRAHVLPYAAPGILTGTVLSLARALGEAAPLILVGAVTGRLGQQTGFFDVAQLQERFTAMPIVITTWAGRPQQGFEALTAAAIVIMLLVVLLANGTAIVLRNRFEKRR
ncbi:phosphate ABC transporter permease PstA [Iamia sp.]|uniref:phosphate ABC transporter permease PstA n=1 Tax=Iamia sp. TaxID=2722710 RepID=UPI002B58C111|nr:phosphate ABC transporter permease PstA [Iamia sp.]HXH56775.1 phosphate ABC transporter permease PstA [Iamia sp.]